MRTCLFAIVVGVTARSIAIQLQGRCCNNVVVCMADGIIPYMYFGRHHMGGELKSYR